MNLCVGRLLMAGAHPGAALHPKASLMSPSQNATWLKLGVDAWTLGWQAARVMGLRTAKMAEGGTAAGIEAWLMLSEKWQSAAELHADLLARGASASPVATTRRTLTHYKRKVAANDRRLR
jgi:hypothetical protein